MRVQGSDESGTRHLHVPKTIGHPLQCRVNVIIPPD